jgi:hypothetical protein
MVLRYSIDLKMVKFRIPGLDKFSMKGRYRSMPVVNPIKEEALDKKLPEAGRLKVCIFSSVYVFIGCK